MVGMGLQSLLWGWEWSSNLTAEILNPELK